MCSSFFFLSQSRSMLSQCKSTDTRHWFCSNDPTRTAHNKDVLAALSMMKIGLVRRKKERKERKQSRRKTENL